MSQSDDSGESIADDQSRMRERSRPPTRMTRMSPFTCTHVEKESHLTIWTREAFTLARCIHKHSHRHSLSTHTHSDTYSHSHTLIRNAQRTQTIHTDTH